MKKLWVLCCFLGLCLLTIGIIHGQSSPGLKWHKSDYGQIYASPALGNDGTIYIGNRSNRFYAVKPDGTIKWSYNTGSVHDSSPAIGSDGTIYVGGRDVVRQQPNENPPQYPPGFRFFAFNPSGTLKWDKANIGGNSSPALGPNGTVYFSSSPYNYPYYSAGNLYAFDPEDGNILWSQPFGGDASPAVGSDGTVYHVSGYNPNPNIIEYKLYALSPNDGSIKWTFNPYVAAFPMAPVASPIVDADGTIFFAAYNVLIAANPNGTEKWRYTFLNMRGISELSLGSDGTLYFGFSGSLYARYANNGTQKWACSLGSNSDNRGAPTVGLDGNIYYVTLAGYFFGIDSQRNIVQQLYLDNVFSPTSPNTSPALAPDGTAYFGGGGGGQYNTATGLYAVQTASLGLADSPWPKFMHDNKNSGRTTINTPAGSDVVVQPVDAATVTQPIVVTFSNVTQAGTTDLTISHSGADAPTGFLAGDPPTYFDISTTAIFSGTIQVSISYSGISFDDESALKLYHYENGSWSDITTSTDTINKKICGFAASLSPFAVFEQKPNHPPVADAGSDQTKSVGNDCQASVTLDGSGSNDADGDTLTYRWTWNGGSATGINPAIALPLGNNTITLVVKDGEVDSAPDEVMITVIDTTPPAITVPADITVGTDSGRCGATINLGTPVASDKCLTVTVTNNAPGGNFFPVGTTPVTYTAKDSSGNIATAVQKVTVNDVTPPVIDNITASPNVIWPPNKKFTSVTINFTVSDNCDASSLIRVNLTVTCNEKITSSDYQVIDAHHVSLRADREGNGTGRIYTITITCSDTKGNSSTQSVQVKVPHDQGQ